MTGISLWTQACFKLSASKNAQLNKQQNKLVRHALQFDHAQNKHNAASQRV